VTYLEYFELTQEPFSNAPVSRFYYNSSQHSQALTRLLHTVSYMKGLSVLIGDIGAGKTTLARRMLDSLPEDEYEAALLVIIHSGITANWLLKRIALQLGVENPAQEKLALLSQLYQRLLQIYEAGKKAVVLIDEAQMLETRELMEEFRGLLNLEVPERKLISFVFFGLPEIEKNLKLDPPLAQRVAMRYRLEPFSADSTDAYIKHRLRLAGCPRNPFAPDAIEALHRRSGGTPRVINTLCDNALFEAFLARSQEIGKAMVEQIADNLGLEGGRTSASVAAPAPSPAMAIPAPVPTAPVPPPPPVAPSAPRPVPPTVAAQPPRVKPVPPRPPPPPAPKPAQVTRASPAPSPAASLSSPPPTGLPPGAAPISSPVPAGLPPGAAPSPARDVGLAVAAAAADEEGDTDDPLLEAKVEDAPPPPPPAEEPVNAEAPPASKPRGVDLAEIDRYLEGLNKL
jgi:type II secretory pathway predicted ATPase ExeA